MRKLSLIGLLWASTALAGPSSDPSAPPTVSIPFTLSYAGQTPIGRGVALTCSRVFSYQMSDQTRVAVPTVILMLPNSIPFICAALNVTAPVTQALIIPTSGLVTVFLPKPQ